MEGFVGNIDEITVENDNFRKVIFTAPHSQLVVMSLQPGEDIGTETHDENDQFIRIEEGEGKIVMDSEEKDISDDWAIVIPAGVEHNIINTSDTDELKLYTIYSPAHHPDGKVEKTKEESKEGSMEEPPEGLMEE